MGANTSCAGPGAFLRRRGVSVVGSQYADSTGRFQPLLDVREAEPDGPADAAAEPETGELAAFEVIEHGADLEAEQFGDITGLQQGLSAHGLPLPRPDDFIGEHGWVGLDRPPDAVAGEPVGGVRAPVAPLLVR